MPRGAGCWRALTQTAQRGAGHLADAAQKVGAHAAMKALRVHRGEHQHAKGRRAAGRVAAAQGDDGNRGGRVGLVQPLGDFKARVQATKGLGQRGSKQLGLGTNTGINFSNIA